MTKNQRYIPISVFRNSTKFAIDPTRIGVVESLYTGCIEVHLANYKFDRQPTPAGGIGLVLAGSLDSIHDWSRITGRLALIAGFDEVFEVACHYDGVVVLRPLGVGLGYRSELASRYANRKSRKRRIQKKHAAKAARFAADSTLLVASLTGTLPGNTRRAEGPYYLLEKTKKWQRATPIEATTLHQARLVARARVAVLAKNGWNCGKASSHGTVEAAPASNVTWLCQKHGPDKWVSVECGDMPEAVKDERAMDSGKRGAYNPTAEEITDACKTWAMFDGFSGEHCYHCLTDQNVLAGGPGFFCPTCGHYNVMSFSDHQMPHKHPEFGPTADVIHAGIRQHRINEGELREDGTEVPFAEWPRIREAARR
jgi:hypothetical protein